MSLKLAKLPSGAGLLSAQSQLCKSLPTCLLSKVLFRQRHLPAKVVFHLRWSSVKGRLPLKAVFRQRSSSSKGRLPSKVVFRQRSSSVKGHLPSKVVFRHREQRDQIFGFETETLFPEVSMTRQDRDFFSSGSQQRDETKTIFLSLNIETRPRLLYKT